MKLNRWDRGASGVASLMAAGFILFVVMVFGVPFINLPGVEKPNSPDIDDVSVVQSTKELGESEENPISVSDITDNPDIYEGLDVTVEASLDEWVTRRAFTVGSPLGGEMLVIRQDEFSVPDKTASERDLALGEEPSNLEIAGTVQKLDIDSLKDQWGVELNEDKLSDWKDKPVLIASSIREK